MLKVGGFRRSAFVPAEASLKGRDGEWVRMGRAVQLAHSGRLGDKCAGKNRGPSGAHLCG